MKLYRNGTTAHSSVVRDIPEAGLRGEVVGWNSQTAMRQKKWLYTVDADALTGHGYAVTLTIRDCPPDAATWAQMRRAWMKRMERLGATRIHWVTEWQERMVPHMHAAVYFQDDPQSGDVRDALIVVAWMQVAEAYTAGWRGQDSKAIEGTTGWLKYMSKHASRGANHYQRTGHPESWNKTGRMWGYTGDWPTVEPIEIGDVMPGEFYRIRRCMRRWAIADARSKRDWKRLAFLRSQPGRISDPRRSRFQAVSEWIPEDVSLRLFTFVRAETMRGVAISEGSIR